MAGTPKKDRIPLAEFFEMPHHRQATELAGVPVRRGDTVGSLPATIEALQEDFDRWVAKKYPLYKSDLPAHPGEK